MNPDTSRHYTLFDRLCLGIDQAVRTLSNTAKNTGKVNPGKKIKAHSLTDQQRQQSAALMRVNHAGEVCAQALYHGQSVASRTNEIQEKLHQAVLEEGDHLSWCQQRLDELDSHASYLNFVWYTGSFCIGMVAGILGDKWSLGFVAETEQQVIKHLKGHLYLLPPEDERSHAILAQMEEDETKHRDEAVASGAHDLPMLIQAIMALTSKVMVKTAYYI
jgi:ubiquinone biosynthesis monooxygenase Coq7